MSARPISWDQFFTDEEKMEASARYGNLCKVALHFYIETSNEAELHYAYLNARWAARLALAESI